MYPLNDDDLEVLECELFGFDDDAEIFECEMCGTELGFDEGDFCPVCGNPLD